MPPSSGNLRQNDVLPCTASAVFSSGRCGKKCTQRGLIFNCLGTFRGPHGQGLCETNFENCFKFL